MVLGLFPVVKLGGILLCQISKPIARFVKKRAKYSPGFRTYICMPPAQFYNWCEIRMKLYAMDMGMVGKISQLSETRAIELGSNSLGEGIVFFVAATSLLIEYRRQARNEQTKEEVSLHKLIALNNNLRDLSLRSEQHDAEINHLNYLIRSVV